MEIILYGVYGFILGVAVFFLLHKIFFEKKNVKKTLFDELNQKYEANQKIIYTLDTENNNLKNNIYEYKNRTEKFETLANQRNVELSTYKERSEKLLADIRVLKDDIQNQAKTLQELTNQTNQLKEEKATANANLESVTKNYNQAKNSLDETQAKLNTALENLSTAKQKISELIENKKYLVEKLDNERKDLDKIKEQFRNEFQILANKILEEKSEKFTRQNKDNIEGLLNPLGKEIAEFKKKIEETYTNETRERHSLEQTIKQLSEQNIRITQEAHNLTQALKGSSKQQGDWGEMILENILEQSGLQKDREYFVQDTLKNKDGITIKNSSGHRLQPDIRIKYPNNQGSVIIDSKVSLIAYEKYTSIEDNDKLKKQALDEHLISIRKHIDNLASKKYHEYIEGYDSTMMFIPIEPAYITAIQADLSLWKYAYDKHIILISPTNLIAVLKLIKEMWQRKYQNDYALEIAQRGGKLYDKFVTFIETLQDIGKHINKSNESYEKAYKQLTAGRGNLIRQVDQLKQLGVKTEKQLPQSLTQLDDEQ